MTKYLKYLVPLISLPFVFNLLRNLPTISHLNYQSLLISFFCFILLYLLGDEISKIFNINSVSLSITFYLMGMYMFNFLILPIDKFLFTFFEIFIFYNLFLLSYILLKSKNTNKIFIIFGILIFIKFLIYFIDMGGFFLVEYNTDVSEFWEPMTKKIYDTDLFIALENNVIHGYPIMINYTFAHLHALFISSSIYTFSLMIPNVFLYLNLLLIFETVKTRHLRINIMILYTSIILNSDWLSYLFINSLMGEVVVNYFFTVFLSNSILNKNIYENKFYFLFLGFLYFLKPFTSVLFVFIAIYFYKNKKKAYFLYLPLFGFLINNIYDFLNILGSRNHGESLLTNFYFDILMDNSYRFFNFKLDNIFLIFSNEIFIDKVLTLFLIIYFLSIILNFYFIKKINIMSGLFLINFILVFYLYTTVWQDIEFGSAYRYIFSFISLMFIDFGYLIKSATKKPIY